MVYYFYVDNGVLFYASSIHEIPSHITDYQTIETNEPYNYVYKDSGIEKITEQDILNIEKEKYIYLIKKTFEDFTEDGYMFSQVLNKEINLGSTHLRNVDSLLQLMEHTGMETTMFRCYDNTYSSVTIEQLKQIKLEMISYGLQLYSKKWYVESIIMSTTSLEELKQLSTDFKDYLNI